MGKVKTEVYLYYIRSLGLIGAVGAIAMTVVNQAATFGNSYWLNLWTENALGNSTEPQYRNLYLGENERAVLVLE